MPPPNPSQASVHPNVTFGKGFVVGLCREFGIPDHEVGELKEELERAANLWRTKKSMTGVVRPGELKKELTSISKSARQLADKLENLAEPFAQVLDASVRVHDYSSLLNGDDKPQQTLKLVTGKDQFLYIDRATLSKLNAAIAQIASDTVDLIPAAKPGAQEDRTLRLWMLCLERIWTRFTGLPFTRDATANNEPLSPAARFCVDVSAKLDEPPMPSRVLNEMKKIIRDRRG